MAKCDKKTLNGIFGMGARLGLDHDQLREMTSTGSLRLVPQAEAQRLFIWLRKKVDAQTQRGPWRLYSSSTLSREIRKYASEIHWNKLDGFRTWLVKYFGIEDLRFVSSLEQATAIKNALKRMANSESRMTRIEN
jgi:hypothetical protein